MESFFFLPANEKKQKPQSTAEHLAAKSFRNTDSSVHVFFQMWLFSEVNVHFFTMWPPSKATMNELIFQTVPQNPLEQIFLEG